MMKTYKEIICDANSLYTAYKAAIKASKWKESTQRFMIDYLGQIFSLQQDLMSQTLRNGRVRNFHLTERGNPRLISSIPLRDRIVRHVLCDNILQPQVRSHIIYDNCASLKGRGIDLQRKRFEVHLHKFYKTYHTNKGWVLFGDFRKFFDNISHSKIKEQMLELCHNDEYISWLLDVVLDGFKVDVSYMDDEEYARCYDSVFNRMEYAKISDKLKTGQKYMHKSVNIGDPFSQLVGIYYPHPIDNYVKYVCGQKCYGRYMDDWYIIEKSKDKLKTLLHKIEEIATDLGIHLNKKKTQIVKLDGTVTFLQMRFKMNEDGKVKKWINPVRIRAMRRKLRKIARFVYSGEMLYDKAEAMFKSWMGSFYKNIKRGKRKRLVQLFCDLFGKNVQISNRKMTFTDRLEVMTDG